jgi:thioredoxin reductase (NADPH)
MHDLIIIGAGPSGLTAGLYAGRMRLNTLLLEKMATGGQILLTPSIENFPGFPGGVATEDLISAMRKQIEELGVNINFDEVDKVVCGPEFKIYGKEGEYASRTVIVASGARPKPLGVPGEERLTGRGVSYCGTCDGPLFKDKEIVLIGGGDRAIEEAIFLSSYAKKVNIIHRRQSLRASGILEEKVQKNPKINFILDSVVDEIIGKERVEAVRIKNVKAPSARELACQGVFIFVGIEPNTAFLRNQLNMDEVGFIMTDENLKASREGIFACGDCRKKSLYQVITACADGAIAADSCHKYLLNR